MFAGTVIFSDGFETGNLGNWTQSGNTSCSAAVSAGSNLAAVVCGYNTDDPAPAHSGTYAALLGPADNGFLTRTLLTLPGTSYTLEFWLASLPNPGVGYTPNSFAVSWDGNSIYSAADLDASGFTRYTFSGLTATGATTDLVIGGFSNVHSYFALDDVSVSQTPEPAAALLLGGALIALGALGRKRAGVRN